MKLDLKIHFLLDMLLIVGGGGGGGGGSSNRNVSRDESVEAGEKTPQSCYNRFLTHRANNAEIISVSWRNLD